MMKCGFSEVNKAAINDYKTILRRDIVVELRATFHIACKSLSCCNSVANKTRRRAQLMLLHYMSDTVYFSQSFSTSAQDPFCVSALCHSFICNLNS